MLRRLRPTVVAGFVAGLLVVAATLSGCGAAGQANPEKYPPAGVDELVIPTPAPDPDDFVAHGRQPVASRSRPARSGPTTCPAARSTPSRSASRTGARWWPASPAWWCGAPRPRRRTARSSATSVTYYAQDRRGNVWTVRRGDDPGHPGPELARGRGRGRGRAGDAGHAARRRRLPARARAGTSPTGPPCSPWTRSSPSRPARSAACCVTEDTVGDPASGTWSCARSYAEGTGLVEESTMTGGTERAVLASVTPG